MPALAAVESPDVPSVVDCVEVEAGDEVADVLVVDWIRLVEAALVKIAIICVSVA